MTIMFKYFSFLAVSIFILLNTSCGRRNKAGFGGNANITFHAYHHSLPIDSFTVYLKFNTLDAPADNDYDTQQASVKVAGNGVATLKGLKKGDYYVFAKGWDPSIQKEVKGGMPYSITSETDLSADVAVTEE